MTLAINDTRMAGALAGGLRWLYRTVQDEQALVDPAGATLAAGHRSLRFVPAGVNGLPMIVVDETYGARRPFVSLHHLTPGDLDCLDTELASLRLPQEHDDVLATGVIKLRATAHPSLLAAVRRYTHGCPTHSGQHCPLPHSRATAYCDWQATGFAAATPPHPLPAGERKDCR